MEGPERTELPGDVRLMTRAALLYHSLGLTQAEVALRLRVSRATAGRLLRRALELGLVRVTIESSRLALTERERALEERFDLVEAVIVPDVPDAEQATLELLGAAAAELLARRLPGTTVLGVAWGATSLEVARRLPILDVPQLQVVQLDGSLGTHGHTGAAERTLALVSGALTARSVGLPAPLYADEQTVASLHADSRIGPVLALVEQCDAALFSVGDTSARSTLFSGRVLPLEALRELRAAGAVGDACGRFFDAAGDELDSSLRHRTVAVSLGALRRCTTSVLVAGGARKAEAVDAALRGRLATVLVTDEVIARHLLESDPPERPERSPPDRVARDHPAPAPSTQPTRTTVLGRTA